MVVLGTRYMTALGADTERYACKDSLMAYFAVTCRWRKQVTMGT